MPDPIRSAISPRPAPTRRGECPHCGTQVDGVHIAGTVYDFQCDPCVEAVDDGFRAFVDNLIGEVPDAG